MNALMAALMLAAGSPQITLQPPEVSLCDLDRFPLAALVEANSRFASDHMYWLLERKKVWLTTEERDYWEARYRDQYWRWDVWSDLRIAQEYASTGYTDGALDKLRAIQRNIGETAYWRGDMPPCCAVWHFQRD